MAKVFLRAGKVGLTIIIPLVLLGVILFGTNYFPVAQANSTEDEEVPLEVQKLNETAKMYISAKEYDLAKQTYFDLVAAYPETEYAVDALGEAGFISAKQSQDDSVSNILNQLYETYSAQPNVTKAIHRLSEGYLLKGKIAAAEVVYSEAISQLPDHENILWLHMGIIKCTIAKNELIKAKEAVEEFKTTYSSHPQLPENIYSLIKPYRRIKKLNKVRDIYQYVALNSTDNDLAVKCQARVADCEIRLGNFAAADEAVKILLDRFSGHKDLCSKLNPLAYKYWVRDKFDKARDIYQYIAQNSSDSRLFIKTQASLVDCEIKLGNYDSADQAIEVLYGYSSHDDFVMAVNKLSKTLRDTGLNAKAVDIIKSYIAEKPTAYTNLGLRTELALNDVVLGNLEEVDGFVSFFMQDASEKGLIVDPNLSDSTISDPNVINGVQPFRQIFPVFEALFAEAGKQICNARPENANQYYQKAIELGKLIDEKIPAPKRDYLSAELYLMIAEGYRHDGQYRNAITYLKKAIRKWPDNKYTSQAEFLLKDCHRRLGIAQ